MSLPKIAIIGAGPAGLTLARLLQHNQIPCTVFEYEKDRFTRSQGGSLDLHEGNGQLALRECGLYEQFLAVARPEGEVLKIFEPDGNLLLDESSNHEEQGTDSWGRPEIDRVQLRDILINSLEPADSLRWDHKLKSVKTDASGTSLKYDLHFESHVETGFDFVVGADGAWSKVRPIITDTRPVFSGITGVDVKFSDIDNVNPALSERVGMGMCLTIGRQTTLLSQRNGDGSVRSYGFLRLPEDWHKTCGIDWSQPEDAKKRLIDTYYEGFNQDAKDLVLKADSEIVPRPLYMLPVGHKWLHRAGTTLIGDAAHLMTPFAGVGVNAAMEDALELARSIIACKSGWKNSASFTDVAGLSAAVRQSEEAMFIRAESYAKETWTNLNLFYNDCGAQPVCELFTHMMEEHKALSHPAETENKAPIAAALEGEPTNKTS